MGLKPRVESPPAAPSTRHSAPEPAEQEDAPLFMAAVEGQLDEVARLLEHGADPGEVDPEAGWTALFGAAQEGHTEIMERLLAAAVDVEHRDWNGRTALHVAAFSGTIDAAALLLDRGWAVDATDAEGRTPLALACHRGMRLTAVLLIDHGADVNRADRDGVTPLMRAASIDYGALVDLLLSSDADPDATDHKSRRACDFSRDQAVAEKLRRGSTPDQETFASYLDRVLPLLAREVKTVYFEWSVTICTNGHIPNGKLFLFDDLDPDLGEWEQLLETDGFYPEQEDDWDPLAFVARSPGPDPEREMERLIDATIRDSLALRAWIADGKRFLWAQHDSPARELATG